MERVKLFIPLIIFGILAIFLGLGLNKETDELPSALIGKPVPEFDLPAIGNPDLRVNRSTFKGKPYLINLWQIQCPGCRMEHKYLLELASKGIPILGVNIQDESDIISEILQKTGNPYVVHVSDADGKLRLNLGSYGTPETYIVNSEGVISHRIVGPISEERWKEKMASIFE